MDEIMRIFLTLLCLCLLQPSAVTKSTAQELLSGRLHSGKVEGDRSTLQQRPDMVHVLGIVQNGRLIALEPGGLALSGIRLTSIMRQKARSVQSGELDLAAFEGVALMVEGVRDSGWLYEAHIIEQAGPILTAVVRRLFGQK